MKEIKIGDTITAKFATLNKNNTLDEYKEKCAKDEKESYQVKDETGYKWDESRTVWRVEPCKVEQYFIITGKEWDEITNSFLDDRILWRGKGGTIYTGTNPNFDYDNFKDEAMLQDFKMNNARLVTIIEHKETGERLAVDPQGYYYARYVGLEVEPSEPVSKPSLEEQLIKELLTEMNGQKRKDVYNFVLKLKDEG